MKAIFCGALTLAGALLLAGCATDRRGWDSRIGAATYDDAVRELGAPTHTESLPNGNKTAEWRVHREAPAAKAYPGAPQSFYFGEQAANPVSDIPPPDRYLRMTFTPDGKLSATQELIK